MNEGTFSDSAALAADNPTKPLGDVIATDQNDLYRVVVKTVQETLNAVLDADAGQLRGARRY